MCYYSQAGVKLPLMRTINQGMSERVKTSEEFENTRKNNWEFALANSMATSLFNFIYPNWRSMFRRFTIPYMTARLLDELKNGAGDWGARHLNKSTADVFTPLINHYAKAHSYDGQFGRLTIFDTAFSMTPYGSVTYKSFMLDLNSSELAQLRAKGIDGLLVYTRFMVSVNEYLYGSAMTTPLLQRMYFPPERSEVSLIIPALTPTDFGIPISELHSSLTQTTSGILSAIVFCPFRLSGSTDVILQKQCTYVVAGKKPDVG